MTAKLELRFRQSSWDVLLGHLFPGDHDEHGAALLCGYSETPRGRRLLVRDVVLAQDGLDYVGGQRGYRHLTGSFVTHQMRRAKDLGLIYLAVHNHGGRGQVSFSQTDLASHERAYPTLLKLNGRPVGGVVVAEGALAGDIWLPDGERLIVDRTAIVGDALQVLENDPPRSINADPSYHRQSLVFGEPGQRRLAGARVGVVGAGGVGLLAVQALSRLGVGELVVIDPERVEPTNLPRLPETTRWDAMAPLRAHFSRGWLVRLATRMSTRKVDVATRIARRASPLTRVQAICRDVADDSVARQLRDCDFVILAADTMLARDVVNQLAYQYLIPTIQLGSKVVLERGSGRVLDVFGVARSLGAEPGCLRCNGLVDSTRLSEEVLADEAQRKNQRYVDDPDVTAPSVITLNMMTTGWGMNDLMHYLVGLGRPRTGFRILRSRPVQGQTQLVVQIPVAAPECHVCGSQPHSALSKGDYADLPTRAR